MREGIKNSFLFSAMILAVVMINPLPFGSPAHAAQTGSPSCPVKAAAVASQPAATQAAGNQSAASQPAASQPAAEEIVLIRFGGGDATITQADFERAVRDIPLEKYDAFRDLVMRRLYQSKLLWLYMYDHPDLVTDEEVDAAVQKAMDKAKLKNLQELANILMEKSGTTMEEFRERKRFRLARTKLVRRGIEMGKDEAKLKAMYQENLSHFDGSRVTASHILLRVQPYEMPAQRQAKRDRLLKMREDIISGQRTWEECLEESECRTKMIGGRLGRFTRHLYQPESVAEAAFSMKVGEFSDIVESSAGFHLIKLTGRTEGIMTLEQAKHKMKIWLQQVFFLEAIEEVKMNHPSVGVRPPIRPARFNLEDQVGSATQPCPTQSATQPKPQTE